MGYIPVVTFIAAIDLHAASSIPSSKIIAARVMTDPTNKHLEKELHLLHTRLVRSHLYFRPSNPQEYPQKVANGECSLLASRRGRLPAAPLE